MSVAEVATVAQLQANPRLFAAAARLQVDAREGLDGADICGAASSLAGNLFVCANPPDHEHGPWPCGHRFVHDTRPGQQ